MWVTMEDTRRLDYIAHMESFGAKEAYSTKERSNWLVVVADPDSRQVFQNAKWFDE